MTFCLLEHWLAFSTDTKASSEMLETEGFTQTEPDVHKVKSMFGILFVLVQHYANLHSTCALLGDYESRP